MSGFRLMLVETGLCNVYMDDVVREMNARALGKGLQLRTAACGWWQVLDKPAVNCN